VRSHGGRCGPLGEARRRCRPYNPFGIDLNAATNLGFVTRRLLEAGPRIFNQTVDTWYFGGGFRGKFGRTALASSTEPCNHAPKQLVVDCAVCGSRSQELISVIVVCEWHERCGGRCSKWRWCRLLGCPSKPRWSHPRPGAA